MQIQVALVPFTWGEKRRHDPVVIVIDEGLRDSGSEPDDEARTVHILYRHYAGRIGEMIRISVHGRYLRSIGMGRDLAVCAAIDRYGIVPILKDGYLQTDTVHGETQTD